MSASLHLARYPAREVVRMVRAMRRARISLEATEGLDVVKLCATIDLVPSTGGRPTPTRWGLFCCWHDAAARDEHLAELESFAPFLEGARESWQVALDTVTLLRGGFDGWRPPTEEAEALRRDEPVAVMTYGRVLPRYIPTFAWNNRKAVRQIVASEGLLAMVGLADGARVASTFSFWRSKGDAVRYAYAGQPHGTIQRRSIEAPWGEDYFFARFRPVAVSGSWQLASSWRRNGSDPLPALSG